MMLGGTNDFKKRDATPESLLDVLNGSFSNKDQESLW